MEERARELVAGAHSNVLIPSPGIVELGVGAVVFGRRASAKLWDSVSLRHRVKVLREVVEGNTINVIQTAG